MRTKIGVLLDATGSMASDRERTIDGFNEYLKGLKEDTSDEATLTLVTFNSGEFEVRRTEAAVQECEPLTPAEYVCDLVTPLFDATARMIGLLERGSQVDRVVCVITTDGLENASRETDFKALSNLIEEKRESGNWTFVFLGADLDAWAAQAQMGVQFASVGNTMSYDKDKSAVAYAGLAAATNTLRGSASLSTERMFPGDRNDTMMMPDQAAAAIGVNTTTLSNMRRQGKGPSFVKVGHRTVRYARRDVEDWKAAQKVTTST